jgi:5-methylcytosine-specific restriction protein A
MYVLARAQGNCEGCGATAPFLTIQDQPYLEPHHIRRLTDGGPDHPRWVVALCPNCHRRAHYSKNAADFNLRLEKVIADLELSLNSARVPDVDLSGDPGTR